MVLVGHVLGGTLPGGAGGNKKGKKGKKKQGKVGMMKNAMAMQKEMKKNPDAFEDILKGSDMGSFLPPSAKF